MNASELLEYEIYPQLDRAVVFQELHPENRGSYFLCDCPKCGEKSAYIYQKGFVLICNRLNRCERRITIWDYIQQKDNLSNQETLYKLAQMANVLISSEKSSENHSQCSASQRKSYILETLFEWATGQLLLNSKVLEYLAKRGITQKEQITEAGLGFIPSLQEMEQAMNNYEISSKELKDLGLLSRKWETHQLVGLWRDRSGQPRTMWGRCLGPVPEGDVKYYLLPGDGSKSTPYMLYKVPGHEVVIVEGFLDALVLQLFGEKRAVAIIGVYITQEQLKTFQRLHIKKAIICLDPDRAGENGIMRNIENLAKIGIQSYVAPQLPQNMDPDEFVLTHGINEWYSFVTQARKGVLWKTQSLFNSTNLSSDLERDKALEKFLEFTGNISNPIETEEACREASSCLNISTKALNEAITKIKQRQSEEELKIKAQRLLHHGQEELQQGEKDTANILQQIKYEFSTLNVTQVSVTPASLDVSLIRLTARTSPEGIRTDYSELDKVVALMPSELSIIGARPRHGKTSFACNLLMNWVKLYKNSPFIFFSYEVNQIQLFSKLVSLLTSYQYNNNKMGGYSYREVMEYLRKAPIQRNQDIEEAMETLKQFEHQIFLVCDPTTTIDQLTAYCKSLKKQWGAIGAILIDYMELVKVPETKSEELRISLIVNELRILSQVLDTPVITLAQMNRSTVTGGGKQIKKIDARRPVLEGLRYSGRQEQEASVVLGLFNRYIESSDASNEEEQSKIEGSVACAPLELITLKNRYGESNKIIKMVFNMVTGNIVEERKMTNSV